MPRNTPPPAVSFEDLTRLRRGKACKKRPYSLDGAREAAITRRAQEVHGTASWWVIPCFGDCGGGIFHLTTKFPNGKKKRALNRASSVTRTEMKARKRERWKRNRRMHEVLAVGTWEDDGGALHPRDAEG